MSIGQPRSSSVALAQQPVNPGARVALRAGSWRRALERFCDRLLTWQERSRQRHHLESLSDHMLRDIGLTRADVMAETTKRFWQP
jgi:uncharacterized protein YjiS (DUF1127 family)